MSVSTNLFILAAVGGLLPDAIRIVKNPDVIRDFNNGIKIFSLVIQVGLGMFAVYLLKYLSLEDTTKMVANLAIETVGLGYAAPQILTKLFSENSDVEATVTSSGPPMPGALASDRELKTNDKSIFSYWAY